MMVLAHALLCVASAWALQRTPREYGWSYVTFIFFLGHGFIGIVSTQDGNAAQLHKESAFIADVIHLPFLNTQFFLMQGKPEYAYIHALSAAVPILSRHTQNANVNNLNDAIDILNMASQIYIAVTQESPWPVFIVINHLLFKFHGRYSEGDLGSLAFGLAIFEILAIHGLLDIGHLSFKIELKFD